MKKILHILLSMVLSANALCAQSLDSLTKVRLGERIEEYFTALSRESLEAQIAEADFMIELSEDSLIRQFTAAKIYEHYAASPVMGAENVAVHLYDRWFSDGRIKMNTDMDLLNARVFAEFNRQSLIGEKAPELAMKTMDGSDISLFGPEDGGSKYRVLFFYDAGCAKCRVESILLKNMFETEDFPIEFYAIYAGSSREAWESYVSERLDIEDVTHIWDPSMDSDFQRKYGVIQTPRMFLVSPDGIIIGRGLDTRALSEMLHLIFDVPEMEYGSDESAELFETVFEGAVSADDVKRIADYIEDSTLGEGNRVMFKQLTGDLLYYLSGMTGEAFKEGAAYLIDEKILSRGDVWDNADDSLKVVGMAEFMGILLSKSEPGTEIAGLKVPAERLKQSGSKTGKFRLDRLRGQRNIIIFYTEGCANCDAEKAAARELAASDKGSVILLVNMDELTVSRPSLAERLFDSFDLSVLPFIIETDKSGTILRRYITLRK